MNVSVIVPMYHGGQYVNAILEQIKRNAEYAPEVGIELLLYNDCPEERISADGSAYAFEVRVVNAEKNVGIHGARVNGLKQASGEYILFLDQDDVICDNYIENQCRRIGDADAVVCRLINGGRLHYTDTFRFEEVITKEFMLNHWCPIVSPGQVLLKKKSIPDIWKNNILTNNGADDYFLWLCMMAEGKRFALNQEVLFKHVITGRNTSENTNLMMDSEQEMLRILLNSHVFFKDEEAYLRRLLDSLRRIHVTMLTQYKEAYVLYDTGMDSLIKDSSLCRVWQETKRIAVYGAGVVGQSLTKLLQCRGTEVPFYIDRNARYMALDIPAYTIQDSPQDIDCIIISLNKGNEQIKETLQKRFDCPIYFLQEFLEGGQMMTDKKVGFTAGVFDCLHVGHLNFLERAKRECDYLIVGLCGDDYVREIKKTEPIFGEEDRKRILEALACVDEVVQVSIEETEDKVLAWKKYKFNVLFSGDDWKGSERYQKTEKEFAALGNGVDIVYFPYTKGVSTTQIKEKKAKL